MNNTDLLFAASYGASVAVIISCDEPQNPSKKRKNGKGERVIQWYSNRFTFNRS